MRQLQPLTAKPVLYVANVAEGGFEGNPLLEMVEGYCFIRRCAGRAHLCRYRVRAGTTR